MSWEGRNAFLFHTCQDLANTEDKVILKIVICTKEEKVPFFSKEFKVKESGNTLIRNVLNLQKENYRIPWRHIKG